MVVDSFEIDLEFVHFDFDLVVDSLKVDILVVCFALDSSVVVPLVVDWVVDSFEVDLVVHPLDFVPLEVVD